MADITDPNFDPGKLGDYREELRGILGDYRDISNEIRKITSQLDVEKETRRSILDLSRRIAKSLTTQIYKLETYGRTYNSIKNIQKQIKVVEEQISALKTEQNAVDTKRIEILKQVSDNENKIAKKDTSNKTKYNLKKQNEELRFQAKLYQDISKHVTNALEKSEDEQRILEAQERHTSHINRNLGFAPAIIQGIDRVLKRLGLTQLSEQLDFSGVLNRTTEKLVEFEKKAGVLPGFAKTSKMFWGEVGASIGGAVTKANLLAFALYEIVKGMAKADVAQAQLQKDFNLTRMEAQALRQEMAFIANTSESAYVTLEALQKSFSAINTSLGLSTRLSGTLLSEYTQLTEQAGFSVDIANKLVRIGTVQNKTSKQLVATALGEIETYNAKNRLALNNRKILEDINNISAGTAAILGNQVDRLAQAASSAAALGTNVSKIESSAESLIAFESSISAELEAQLLTGRNINLDRARQLSLEGKLPELAEELKKQMGGLAEFQRLNVIQAEGFAKSLGFSRNELAQMLLEQETLVRLSAVEGRTLQEKYNNLVKQKGQEAAMAELGNDSLSRQLNAVSNQERLTRITEKLLGIFVQLGDTLMPIFDALTWIVDAIAPRLTRFFQSINDMAAGIMRIFSSLFTFNWEEIKSGVSSGFALAGRGLANFATGGVFNFQGSKSIQPLAEGGIVNKPTLSLVGESGPEAVMPLSKLNNQPEQLEELRKLNSNIELLLNNVKDGSGVYLDTYKVGVAMPLGSMKLQ